MRGRVVVFSLVLAAAAGAAPGGLPDPETALLERWPEAGPDERRDLAAELDRIGAARRFVAARPVLVEFKGQLVSVAELFGLVLDPALETPTGESTANDPALADIHRDALAALAALRVAYAAPRPVRAGTMNLLLDYGARALRARALPRSVRLRFFADAVRGVRELEGRAEPDARTRWLLHERVLPPLMALAREAQEEGEHGARLAAGGASREAVTEAASLLYVPSLLDDRARARLAPLAAGVESRAVLLRFFRHGQLDDVGRVALAKGVAVEVKSDPAFAATAPPLLLELLCDPAMPSPERRAILEVVRDGVAAIDVLKPSAQDLLAAGFGGPPRPLPSYDESFARYSGGVLLPAGPRPSRVLSV